MYCRKVRVEASYSFQRNNLWQFLCAISILPFIKFLTIQKLEKVPYVIKEKKEGEKLICHVVTPQGSKYEDKTHFMGEKLRDADIRLYYL